MGASGERRGVDIKARDAYKDTYVYEQTCICWCLEKGLVKYT